jgi:hypothetical protein
LLNQAMLDFSRSSVVGTAKSDPIPNCFLFFRYSRFSKREKNFTAKHSRVPLLPYRGTTTVESASQGSGETLRSFRASPRSSSSVPSKQFSARQNETIIPRSLFADETGLDGPKTDRYYCCRYCNECSTFATARSLAKKATKTCNSDAVYNLAIRHPRWHLT